MTRLYHAALTVVIVALAGLCAIFSPAEAGKRHVAIELLADRTSVAPGASLTLAIKETIEEGWHTYWINAGDSGEPTMVEWRLPAGVTAGDLLWPAPKTIQIGSFVNYGFERSLTLLAPLHVPDAQPAGPLAIGATVRLLVCKDICVPEESDLNVSLEAGAINEPSPFINEIETVRAGLPEAFFGQTTFIPVAGGGLELNFAVPPQLSGSMRDAYFFAQTENLITSAAPQRLRLGAEAASLRLQKNADAAETDRLDGVIAFTDGSGKRTAYTMSASPGSRAGPLDYGTANLQVNEPASTGAGQPSAPGGIGGLGAALVFAFLGGLILNAMPCVFPVLALKALSFASRRDGNLPQGLAYLGGVMASFAGFALVLAFVKSGGNAFGWGFQFQTPAFVLALAALFFVLGLNLSGAVSAGSSLAGLGDGLTRRPGMTGTFFTGALAALAATPCTAPLMGAAIGYAIAQPTAIMAAVILMLGLGFAAPVFALSLSPGLQKLMPRPGAWMETLKELLAFPLYITAAWLVWVLSLQTGADGVFAAAIALVGVGFAAWLANKTALSTGLSRVAAPILGIAFVVAGALALPSSQVDAEIAVAPGALREEAFSQARLNEILSSGRPVFVNLTAAWCITCKVNEHIALRSPALARAFANAGIAYLKGDWTKANPEITALLDRFGRAGVPLYLYYPGHNAEPKVLPQFLTAGIILSEIAAAQGPLDRAGL